MSQWREYEFEGKIVEILQSPEFETNQPHHFGHPYVTAYQLAVAFEKKYPELCRQLNKTIGSTSTGDSLPRYIAHQLSATIRTAEANGELCLVEAAWLSSTGLGKLRYLHDRTEEAGGPNSMNGGYSLFRLKQDQR